MSFGKRRASWPFTEYDYVGPEDDPEPASPQEKPPPTLIPTEVSEAIWQAALLAERNDMIGIITIRLDMAVGLRVNYDIEDER